MSNVDEVCTLKFADSAVRSKVLARYELVWSGLHHDPRQCPSEGAARCTYLRWFGSKPEGRSIYHPHVRLVGVAASHHKLLMRFRLGCWKIAVVLGRHNNTPRERRLCEHCGSNQVEDERHVVFECSLYGDIRNNHKALFQTAGGDMCAFFNQKNQVQLVRFLLDVHTRRTSMLND